jgi:hypothetical protein
MRRLNNCRTRNMNRGEMGDEDVDNHERLGQSPAILVNE